MDHAQIDKKLESILRDISKRGIKLDIPYLEGLVSRLKRDIFRLEKQIYSDIGHQFNIGSPKQLAEILYQDLNLSPTRGTIKKGKTGFSTSAKQLEKIKNLHPSIGKILKYRQLSKLLNTYVEPLPKMTDKKGRIHSHWAVDTASGRISSKEPNLQNIPIRTKEGRKIRQAFIAEKGNMLVSADYSQIELRVAAHLSGDTSMVEAFKNGRDIHKEVAREMGVDRRIAKIINFGILYGISAYGLNETLVNYSREEVQGLIDRYFSLHPVLAEYVQKVVELAYKKGYAGTLFGRLRKIPELKSPSIRIKEAGERIAINHPIQGTAAEILKLAMIELDRRVIKSYRLGMILTIHDELVIECQKEEVNKITKQLKNIMENIIQLKVPLEVKIKIGKNWGDMEE